MSHAEMLAALDRRLDALLSGTANFVDLTDDSPEALELEQLLSAARLTIQVLDEPLSPATRARHMRMLEAAAACRIAGPDSTLDSTSDATWDATAAAVRSPDMCG